MKSLLAATAVVFALLTAPANADDKHHAAESKAAVQKTGVLTNAEVRKVDKAAKKITLKHDEIKSMDMPPMTMVFQVKDPAMLDQVKLGDKVKFAAENVGGAIVVTDIQVAK